MPTHIHIKTVEVINQTTINNSSAGRSKNHYNNGGSSIVNSQQAAAASASDDQDVMVRKYGEVFLNTLSSVAAVLEYPKGIYIIKIV